ncbi:MAG TPA: RNA methyltransferase [Anaerolineae bacterium]|nr:RNA methyltransferase [Anaerolineae bacterium]
MITSTQNQLVKRIRRLGQKKYRSAENSYFVEGLRLVGAAIEAGAEIEALVWCDTLLVSDFGRNLLTHSPAPTIELSDIVFRTISQRDNPMGLGAIVKTPANSDLEKAFATASLLVALDSIADPGNLGTILRSVDAVGADGVILVGNCVDPYHPTAIKASMGALFSVPIFNIRSLAEVFDSAEKAHLPIIATSANADFAYKALPIPPRMILLMGSEKLGLPTSATTRATHSVALPMRGTSSSLNIAVATSILLYEYAGN